MENFSNWLANEMKKRGLSPADLARLSGKAPAVISRILNNERDPAPETLTAIARALRLPPETVFRAAGLLPPVPPDTEYQEEFLYLLAQLPPEERQEILDLLRFKAERKSRPSRAEKPARSVLKER